MAVCCCRIADLVRAQLAEQPRVLDGDHGLRGEVLHQLDLLVGERPDFLAVDADAPISSSSLSIGTDKQRASAAKLDASDANWIPIAIGRSSDVGNVHDLLRCAQPTERRLRWSRQRACARQCSAKCGRRIMQATRRETRRPRRATCCRTWRRKCASRFPAWPGTPAPVRPASWR